MRSRAQNRIKMKHDINHRCNWTTVFSYMLFDSFKNTMHLSQDVLAKHL